MLLAPDAGAPGVLLSTVVVAARLYGDFAYRNGIVTAGAYEPIQPSFPQRALGAG
jgi:hypothetical protein